MTCKTVMEDNREIADEISKPGAKGDRTDAEIPVRTGSHGLHPI